MQDFKRFFKHNKKAQENVKYKATKSLTDENGEPLEWEIRPLTSKQVDEIREESTREVVIDSKKGLYRHKVDMSKYMALLLCGSVVYPDLKDAELQSSYGVMGEEDLIKAMIDSPSEYTAFSEFVQTFNGFDVGLDEKVDEAKN